jgi:hypothetical protein
MSNRQAPRRRKPGDYLGDLVALALTGRLPVLPGTVNVVSVRHDADCKRPAGGRCTCVADLVLEIRPTAKGPTR